LTAEAQGCPHAAAGSQNQYFLLLTKLAKITTLAVTLSMYIRAFKDHFKSRSHKDYFQHFLQFLFSQDQYVIPRDLSGLFESKAQEDFYRQILIFY
jgi:hypothetical protein